MRRNTSTLHWFLTLMLLVGLLFGSFGKTFVSALDENTGIVLGMNAAPNPLSFKRQSPSSTYTNTDSLTFRIEFSDSVSGVDKSDFIVHNNAPEPTTDAAPQAVTRVSDRIYDVNIFGGDLDSFNGFVGLDFSPNAVINNAAGSPIPTPEPAIDETYLLDNVNPGVVISQAPGQPDPTDTLPVEFTVEFDEVINATTFTIADITQAGTASSVVWSISGPPNEGKVFTLTATTKSNNSTIVPTIDAGRVNDRAGNSNQAFTKNSCDTNPPDNCVRVNDAVHPTVIISQAPAQDDPAATQPVVFMITFSETINLDTFERQDILLDRSWPPVAHVTDWSILDTADPRTFKLVVWSDTNGKIVPIIPANSVLDLLGNGNEAFSGGCNIPEPNNCVTLQDEVRPTVTIEQHPAQQDPTINLPIRFVVTFSEPINVDDFTPDVIRQLGTAKSTWLILDTGDHRVFTLYATQSTRGTLIPVIPEDKVRDLLNNFNLASTSVDNKVTYNIAPPTPTPEQVPFKNVVISEVAWMGTSSLTPSDEWIELHNTTNEAVSMDGWHLVSFRWSGTTTNGQWVKNLDIAFNASDIIQPRNSDDPKNTSGYYLLERGINSTDDDAVRGIEADKIYTSYNLSDSGEILLLCSKQNMEAGVCEVNSKNKLVDYVNASYPSTPFSNPWPAGKGSPLFGTMDRKFLASDEDWAWFTHPASGTRYGHDRNWDGTSPGGNLINGTPKHENWSFEVTATPLPTVTPTRTPTRAPNTATALLVLNEVLARSGSDWNNDGKVDVYDEFIEVVNSGTVNVILSNFKLDDGLNAGSAPFSLPNQTLKPGEKAVFYGSQTGLRLEDSGDTVRLLRASNNSVVDAVTYPIAKSVDTSVCRYTDGYGSWLTNCFPTPGRPNALTGQFSPSTSGGSPIPVCFLPDSTPNEFVLAECGIESGGIWNHLYWDSFPGEGTEIWQVDPGDKWLVIYQ